MARYLEATCRLCRREGMKLMLKGTRCETAKCAIERREKSMAPGMHGWRRGRHSDYGVRLREKQKLKRYYGLMEKQFMSVFREATRRKGNTGRTLLELLERRLDNVIFKLNFAPSRKAARQLIAHGHIYLNGRRVDIPDRLVNIGDKITLKNSEHSRKIVKTQLEANPNFQVQGWLQLDASKPAATVVALPTREDVQLAIEEQLVVEFCSK
ncbi:MAG TPA: 30S ribosomal protein S4 [Anaerohalosphaeraceae bacterium]|nr:30S ribosomal protein S4 [Anaerohalosphaeraceae bacterium]HQG05276.1 30S ribosomal protein S4 [Anaerohalosphaeraceae bacterium]HQI06994.1 30S ribosomal protein S4 [Anaerohalosphaeraceae bacterium]HQJ66690.1 30S ribosomal protein S4 [Anaerohalosphaeraceae bacterium]